MSFVYEDEWRDKIFQPENDGKDGAIDFYFRTLDNILVSNSEQLTLEYVEPILNLIKALNKNPYVNNLDKDKNFYRNRISAIEKQLLEIQKKLESAQLTQKGKKLFKNIKDLLKHKKSLQTSKSVKNLLSKISASKKSQSKNKPLLLDNNIETLKKSSSMGNFLEQRKKSVNNKSFLNLSTIKSKTNQINTNINSINIKSMPGSNNGQPKLEETYKMNFKKKFKNHDAK